MGCRWQCNWMGHLECFLCNFSFSLQTVFLVFCVFSFNSSLRAYGLGWHCWICLNQVQMLPKSTTPLPPSKANKILFVEIMHVSIFSFILATLRLAIHLSIYISRGLEIWTCWDRTYHHHHMYKMNIAIHRAIGESWCFGLCASHNQLFQPTAHYMATDAQQKKIGYERKLKHFEMCLKSFAVLL